MTDWAWTRFLPTAGESNGLADFLLKSQNDASQRQMESAQTQVFNAQAQAKAQAMAQDQQFQTDWAEYEKNPNPQALLNLQGRYPDKASNLAKIYDAQDTAVRTSNISYLGSLNATMTPNKDGKLPLGPDGAPLALTVLKQRRDADKAASKDTSEDDYLIDAVSRGDMDAINSARAMVQAHLAAAAGPDKFAAAFGAITKPEEGYTLGNRRYDSNNNVVAEAPFAQQFKSVPVFNENGEKVGERVISLDPNGEGGGPASGGSGSKQPYTGGWTPRRRNGGDNPDVAVDGKISGMSSALGIDPDTPFPPGTSNMAIAKALTLSEGGAGSVADRNNNPGNLKDPKTGAFRQFPTKEAGLAAAAAQVARNRARGQNSIRTMVEGVPVAGGSASQTKSPSIVYESAGTKPSSSDYVAGTDVGGMSASAIDAAAQRYNMTGALPVGLGRKGDVQRAILSRAAQFSNGTDVGGQIGDQASRKADIAALTSLQKNSANVLSFERTALRNASLAVRLSVRVANGDIPIFNSWKNAGSKANGDPNIAAFDAAVQTFANEYAKVTSSANGGGVTSDSARQHAYDLINSSQSPQQFIATVQTLAKDMANRRAGLETERKSILLRIKGNGAPQAPPTSGWGKAQVVK